MNSAQHITNHMIEEQSRTSQQLGKVREGGMETEKLSSRLAQNTKNTTRADEQSVLGPGAGFDLPNHVVSSLRLTPKRRRVISEEHLEHVHTQKQRVFLYRSCYSQFLSTSLLYKTILALIEGKLLSFSCTVTHLLDFTLTSFHLR